MTRLADLLKRLLFRARVLPESEAERLRIGFKARYQSFKLLLDANNKALEVMSELGETLREGRGYGMTYVRARCTRAATRVWQMIRNLDDLASGKYAPLQERFRSIREEVNRALAIEPRPVVGDLVLHLDQVGRESASQVGEKMSSLGEIRRQLKVKIPNGFVVTAAGFRRFMEHNQLHAEIDRRLQAAGAERLDDSYELSTEIQRLIRGAELPGDLETAILEHYRRLEEVDGAGVRVAVRSSGLGEDAPGSSFAGQHHSELNVAGDSLLDTYKMIVASKYSLPAMTYRLNRGIRDENVTMCVGIMSMVDSTAGGVAYTRNPVVAGDDSIIVNSAWGLPLQVAEGSSPSDRYVVKRGRGLTIAEREIGHKRNKISCRPGQGIVTVELDEEDRARGSLTDEQVLDLARLGLRLEEYHSAAQDIEWAVGSDGTITLLQCRQLELAKPSRTEDEDRSSNREPVDEEPVLRGGLTASPGAAAGPVFVVHRGADALDFPEGAVLVTAQALPLWAPMLGRAVAVVTEHGSAAGHLATVAREYGVPALFRADDAVERLEDGETVTVDADGRAVYRGRVEPLLARAKPAVNPMEGSPVHLALSQAARHITPLNLVDPDSPEFRAENCRTYHDIARFCHEKSVQEMFRFGRDHHFPQRSSKQLFCEIPMQWWVLNLDDGFKEEVDDKYVRLENIASLPMLAVWEGITAVPWEGPPPVDGKGFASVMLKATTDAGLSLGSSSRYTNRNYFMISRDYCCLNSRLGAHFSITEALVGDRESENYISFQFKGGAADFRRRLKRVLFVKEILEEYGFRVQVNEDNVIARMEGAEREFMVGRLKILGYLNIHTRQLDMIMLNASAVDYYRKKIHKDITGVLAGAEQPAD